MTWLAAALSLVLLGWLARRYFSSVRAALICCALFLTMPVVWSAVAASSSYLPLLPLAIAWLLFVNEYLITRHTAWMAAAAVALAAMPYVHWSGMVLAPVYAAITLATLVVPSWRGRDAIAFTVICAVLSAPWLWSLARGATPVVAAINAHGLYDADRFNILQGMREMTSWVGLTVRSEVYWDCFNPAFLFLGKGGLMENLFRPEMFVLPMVVPLALGLAQYARAPQKTIDWVVLAALLAAPIVAGMLAQPPAAARLLLLTPAAAIISARPFSRRA